MTCCETGRTHYDVLQLLPQNKLPNDCVAVIFGQIANCRLQIANSQVYSGSLKPLIPSRLGLSSNKVAEDAMAKHIIRQMSM